MFCCCLLYHLMCVLSLFTVACFLCVLTLFTLPSHVCFITVYHNLSHKCFTTVYHSLSQVCFTTVCRSLSRVCFTTVYLTGGVHVWTGAPCHSGLTSGMLCGHHELGWRAYCRLTMDQRSRVSHGGHTPS